MWSSVAKQKSFFSFRACNNLLRNLQIYSKTCDSYSYVTAVNYFILPIPCNCQTGIVSVRLYSSIKKESVHIKAVKGREILQNVFEKKRDVLLEKKNDLVKDIREKKTKVKAKVEEVIERENILTIPNLLTVGRGILAPYLGFVIIQNDFSLAMILLIAAGITDLLDGQIARHWPKQASKFGSFLDPLADKLLVGSLVISLGYCSLLPVWLAGMILFRDAFLVAAGFVIRYISLPPPRTISRYFDATHVTAQLEPTFVSKVNTAAQLLTIGLSLGAPIWGYIDHPVLHGLWYLAGTTTIAAAISYIINRKTYRILNRTKKNIE